MQASEQNRPSVQPGLVVALREITAATVREVVELHVSEKQWSYVAPNGMSIAEAHFNSGAWFRAIYADETPVGFVMLFDPTLPDAAPREGLMPSDIALWRFMIDHRYQRMGFGRRALDLVGAHARTRPGTARIVSSYVPGPEGPRTFYLRYGFVETGRLRRGDREVEIAMTLV